VSLHLEKHASHYRILKRAVAVFGIAIAVSGALPLVHADEGTSQAVLPAESGQAERQLLRKIASAQREHAQAAIAPEFPPCDPVSAPSTESARLWSSYGRTNDDVPANPPSLDFCAEWNPEFPFNGHHCCRNLAAVHQRKTRMSCFVRRPRGTFCEEMTDEQKNYIKAVQAADSGDVLQVIAQDMGAHRDQSYCTGNNGFLAYGRPIVPTTHNRLLIRSPQRCTQFGSDAMVGMVEWLGQQVDVAYPVATYPGVHLIVGDVSAPRGGCLSGVVSVIGHKSHTNGTDADIGFLAVRGNGRLPSPVAFHFDFDPKLEWWFAKQVFHNPYACVKVIFLDRKLIRKLAKYASRDPEWREFGRFFRHMPGHKNHMHIRVGTAPGRPGCALNAHPELETEGDMEDGEGESGSDILDDLGVPPGIQAGIPGASGRMPSSSTKSSSAH
jgi:murein endopeptidase